MYDVFVFFLKDHESGEKRFFENKCSEKEGDLRFWYDDNDYCFFTIQNALSNDANNHLIDFMNSYCINIKKFLDGKKVKYNNQLIIAVHPPGSLDIVGLLDWQRDKNKTNKSSNYVIVYYSSKDYDNVYLENHKELFDYDYEFLFLTTEKTKEEKDRKKENFKKLLKLLKARAEGKEIEFFNFKKKLDNLFHLFFEKALVCKGLLECLEKKRFDEAKTYYIQSFGEKSFETILSNLKDNKEVKGIEIFEKKDKAIYKALVGKLRELKPEYYKDLSNKNLEHNENKLIAFMDWYVDFLEILVNSLREVEKSGN